MTTNNLYLQIMHAIEKLWKISISPTSENINNLVIQDNYLIKKHQMFCLSKPTNIGNCLNLILANNIQ